MNNKLLTFFSSFIFCLLIWAFPMAGSVFAAPNLQFGSTSVTAIQNTTFSVVLRINAEANNVRSSDVTLLYAGSDLEVSSVTGGSFFPSFAFANDPSGQLELHGYTSFIGDSRTGTDTYATIVFKAKKASGSSVISFVCSGSGQDTNILTTTGQNILSCQELNQIAVIYSDGVTPNPTPTPTIAAGVTPTPTPAQSGNTIPACMTLAASTSFGVGAPFAVTFTCSGVDPDGYINAAEFTFGDGTRDTIYQNVGSPGSISTTHTYTTIGTLGATCRVRDNNNVFSNTSNDCKRIIVINPKPVVLSSTSYYSRVIAPNAPITDLTPTPAVIAIDYVTPTQEPLPTAVPTPTAEVATATPLAKLLPFIFGGILIIALAFLLLRRKNPPPPYTPPVPPPAA